MDTSEIERRKPVWLAISEFYLDTSLSDEEINNIKKVFDNNGYSIKELKEINYFEVEPIVGGNLLSTAGVWSGFDPEWLWGEIIKKRLNKKRRNNLFTRIGKFFVDLKTDYSWRRIEGSKF